MIYPGTYCDVAATMDGLAFVYVRGLDVVAMFPEGSRYVTPMPEPLMFVRCGVLSGRFVSVGQGHDTGTAWVMVDGAAPVSFGLTFGVQPVCVGPDGLYIVRNSVRVDVLSLAGTLVRQYLVDPTTQGIRDITPDGELRMSDAWFRRDIAGLTLIQPSLRRGVMVGQCDPPQIAGVVGETLPFTAIDGVAYEPHVAYLGDDRYAICARTPIGAQLVLVPPYRPFMSQPAPAPPLPEPPQPEPPMPSRVLLPETPTFWQNSEFPQAIAARQSFLGDRFWQPDPGWCVFQTLRRYGLETATPTTTTIGAPWSIRRIVAWELNPVAGNPAGSQEPPQ